MSAAWVYRVYDANERLIYVGATRNLFGRLDNHRAGSWWMHQAARVRGSVYPGIDAARAAERHAIRTENPRWNVKGRWQARDTWTEADFRDYALVRRMQPPTGWIVSHLRSVERECYARFGQSRPPSAIVRDPASLVVDQKAAS